MQKLLKKIYFSIIVTVLCFATLTVTTYAWVGIFTSSSFDNFTINLFSNEFREYGVEISLTGEEGTFGSTVDEIELKREILENYGMRMDYITTDQAVQKAFSELLLTTCSVKPNEDNSFNDFLDMYDNVTTKYIKFDVYISAYRAYDSGSTSEYLLDAYLTGNLFEGTKRSINLINEFTYPSDFINNVEDGIQGGTKIKNNVSVDSSSCTRIAIQKYNVVEKGHPEAYNDYSIINDYVIYQQGPNEPIYNPLTNIYSFGGILEEEYNLALFQYNQKFSHKRKNLPDWALLRNDIDFSANSYNQIIDSTNPNEKISTNDMMKLTIYFWFEGWDADCFEVIDNSPVTFNLNFTNNIN
ncbi:MAG: hypothetical protein ACI35S_06905 [Anaeroplasma sp.]